MTHPDLPLIAVTSGDPAGIGPDICLQLLSKPPAGAKLVVLADKFMLAQRAKQLNISADYPEFDVANNAQSSIFHISTNVEVEAGKPDSKNAEYVLALLEQGISFAKNNNTAIVTAPVAKSVITASGKNFTGHTEFFAEQTQTKTVVMAFVSPKMRLALVTTHIPLSKVSSAITTNRTVDVLSVADAGMRKLMPNKVPRWLVCGLNPHAGEDGMLGSEDKEVIEPAIAKAKEKGIKASGPIPADTAFLPERLGDDGCVLGMYHDQVLPVAKYADFANTVNVTFGLPFIRTSVDHGTAFELAGTGKANPTSLFAATNLAIQILTPKR